MLARLPVHLDGPTVVLASALRVFLRGLPRKRRRAFMIDTGALVAAAQSPEADALWRLIMEAAERDAT